MSTYKDTLQTLEQEAAKLNELTDLANQKINSFEEKIIKMNIGIEWWHTTPFLIEDKEITENEETKHHHLAFGKVNNEWCLYVISRWNEKEKQIAIKSKLSKTKRAIRLAAASKLEEFVLAFAEAIKQRK